MRSAGGRAGVESGQRKPGQPSGWVRLAAPVYVATLAVLTLLPTRWPPWAGSSGNNDPKLVPFDNTLVELKWAPLWTLTDLFGNVLLFVPFGFLLPLLVPAVHRWWQVLAVGAGVSLLIELYQLAFPAMREASVTDVLMNALGAVLGFVALRLTGYRRDRSTRRQGAGRPRPP
jgi:glycopeptide antibiotics resistance protein